MEEDIKILEEMKNALWEYFEDFKIDKDTSSTMKKIYEIRKVQVQAIEKLIKGYRELEERTKKNIEPVLVNNKMYFIDKELYEDLLKDIKTSYIVKSKVKEKIDEVNNSNGYSPVNKIFIEQVLQELMEG